MAELNTSVYPIRIAMIALPAVLAISVLTGCDVPSPEVQACHNRAADYAKSSTAHRWRGVRTTSGTPA